MNRTAAEGEALAREIVGLLGGATPPCEVALCPAFPALEAVGRVLRGTAIRLGAQNLHPEPHGAYTGEVSGPMLAAAGCHYVIVGHSERRHGMGEDDATVARKLRAALRDGLAPILCVGETLAERDGGRVADVLVRQVRAALDGLEATAAARVVIAYEPVWAIGTGRVASPGQAREAHAIVRETVTRVVGPHAGAAATLLYGGSVNAGNAVALFAEPEVDGALVGGAALEPAGFLRIIMAAVDA